MNNQNSTELPLQTRAATFGNVDEKSRTAELIWSTGARVKRYDWERGRYYWEELGLRDGEVILDRLNSGAPLLNTHNRYSLDDVLGVVEPGTAKVDGARGTATVRFSSREDVAPIFRDVKDKIIVNVSAGYMVHRMQETDELVDGIPVYRAVSWTPAEISLVPIGADDGAKVRGESKTTFPCEFLRKDSNMPNDASAPEERAQPSKADQFRVRKITELVERNNLPKDYALELIQSDKSIEEARTAILSRLAEITNRTQIQSGIGAQNADLGPAMERDLITEMLAARFGGLSMSERAQHYVGMTLPDIARVMLEQRGRSTRGWSRSRIIDEVMQLRTQHGVSDFAEMLSGTGYRILLKAYEAHQSGISKVFKKTTAPDFRARQVLALSEGPALEEVKAGGEYKYGTMAESKESYTLTTYGKIMGLNRQALVNDDLNAFGRMSQVWGQSAAEHVANTLATLVNSNPTLATSTAQLFSTQHANLTTGTANAAISVDSIGEGVRKMRLQKGLSGNVVLGLAPRYLLVPAAMEQLAKQYTSSAYQPAAPSGINPWQPTLEVVVEPRLDALSTSQWYMFADPSTFETLEYAYLEGEEGPQMFTREGWNIDGIEFKCRLDLGAGAVEYRGAWKNNGA